MTIIKKSLLSSVVGIIPSLIAALLLYATNNGKQGYTNLGEGLDINLGLIFFVLFILPFILTIAFFLLYKLAWTELSKNDSTAINDFRWGRAGMSFIGIIVLILFSMYIIDSHKISGISGYAQFICFIFVTLIAIYATLHSKISSFLKPFIVVGLIVFMVIIFVYYMNPFTP